MSQVEPMTAAEYRQWCNVGLGVNTERILAALEERERLLGEVAVMKDERDRAKHEAAEVRRLTESDAALGALVRRIGEHEAADGDPMLTMRLRDGTWNAYLDQTGLAATLSRLDSLLPKEPEVAPSGWRYKWSDGEVLQVDHVGQETPITDGPTDEMVPPCDAPVVAALMAKGGKDG